MMGYYLVSPLFLDRGVAVALLDGEKWKELLKCSLKIYGRETTTNLRELIAIMPGRLWLNTHIVTVDLHCT